MVVASDFDLNRDETNSIAREDGAGTRARGLTKTFRERLRAGLQNAGKTSFIDALSGGTFEEDMIPTVGFNVRRLRRDGVSVKTWDLG